MIRCLPITFIAILAAYANWPDSATAGLTHTVERVKVFDSTGELVVDIDGAGQIILSEATTGTSPPDVDFFNTTDELGVGFHPATTGALDVWSLGASRAQNNQLAIFTATGVEFPGGLEAGGDIVATGGSENIGTFAAVTATLGDFTSLDEAGPATDGVDKWGTSITDTWAEGWFNAVRADTLQSQTGNLAVASNLSITSPSMVLGSRHTLLWNHTDMGDVAGTSVAARAGEVLMVSHATLGRGFLMHRAGSVIGISIKFETSGVGGDYVVDLQVRKNATVIWANEICDSCGAGAGKEGRFTQARGIDTFVAGDVLTAYVIEEPAEGTVTVKNVIGLLEVVYND